jgi:hypothetical protein
LNLLIFRTVISFSMCIHCQKFCRLSILICFFSHFFLMAWNRQVGTERARKGVFNFAPHLARTVPR